MRIVVIGCGRLGAELSFRLFQHNHQVVVIDHSADAFGNLHHDFRGKTIEGDAISQAVLLRAGIQEADGIAAVTNSDVMNAIVGRIARIEYGIDKIVVRNYDARWQSMHDIFGHQTVSSTLWGVDKVEELLHHSCLRLVYSNTIGNVNIFELIVPHAHQGKNIMDIVNLAKSTIISVIRGSDRLDYDDSIKLATGDILHISADTSGAAKLKEMFKLPEER